MLEYFEIFVCLFGRERCREKEKENERTNARRLKPILIHSCVFGCRIDWLVRLARSSSHILSTTQHTTVQPTSATHGSTRTKTLKIAQTIQYIRGSVTARSHSPFFPFFIYISLLSEQTVRFRYKILREFRCIFPFFCIFSYSHSVCALNAIYPLLLVLLLVLLLLPASLLSSCSVVVVFSLSSTSTSTLYRSVVIFVYVVFGLSFLACCTLSIKVKQFHFVCSLSIIVCFSVAVR